MIIRMKLYNRYLLKKLNHKLEINKYTKKLRIKKILN